MSIIRKTANELSSANEENLRALSANDSEIDTSDIPALSAEELARFMPAKLLNRSLYKPVKVSIKINYDADILEWFKSFGKGYQTRMNTALREHMYANCMREPKPEYKVKAKKAKKHL